MLQVERIKMFSPTWRTIIKSSSIFIVLYCSNYVSSANSTDNSGPFETPPKLPEDASDLASAEFRKNCLLEPIFNQIVAPGASAIHSKGECEYFERDFDPEREKLRNLHSSVFDTATNLINDLTNGTNKFLIILGERQSGKTAVLGKMQQILLARDMEIWSVVIDLPQVLLDVLPYNWHPQNLFLAALQPRKNLIFNEILENKPKKLYIFLDNIDKINSNVASKILQYTRELVEKEVRIVVTSSLDIGLKLSTIVSIPRLNLTEIATLFTWYWNAEFGSHYKIIDYANAVAKLLDQTPIPRNFGTIKQLGLLLTTENPDIFIENFVSVEEYIKNDTMIAEDIFQMLETVKINKIQLFETLFTPSQKANDVEKYGILALTHILSSEPIVSQSSTELRRAQRNFIQKNKQLNFQKLYNEYIFFCNEYQYYFAAKYITHQNDITLVLNIAKTLFLQKKPAYVSVIEYLNAFMLNYGYIKFLPVLNSIVQDCYALIPALDNALSCGFDRVAAAIIEKLLNDPTQLEIYFIKKDSDTVPIYSKTYKLGLLSVTDEKSLYSRYETAFKNNMEKTIEILLTTMSTPNLWKKYLKKYTLSCPRPNLKIYRMIMETVASDMDSSTYNDLLFTAANFSGWYSRFILIDLKNRGAEPSKIVVNNESLVHIALKQRNPPFLQFITGVLNVTMEEIPETKSLLITLLDANPLNLYSQPRFWEIMEMYITQGQVKIPHFSSAEINYQKTQKIAYNTSESLVYYLLTGTDNMALIEAAISEMCFSSRSLDKLSPETRSYRRNLVLSRGLTKFTWKNKDNTTLTEILLKYRGLDTLMPLDDAAYKRCIYLAFVYDVRNSPLTEEQLKRIGRNLVDNIGTEDDYNFAVKFASLKFVQENLTLIELHRIVCRVHELVNSRNQSRVLLEKHTLEIDVSKTRSTFYQTQFQASKKH